MIYKNTELRLDQIVQYFNDEKINLSPAFQRGHRWSTNTRRALIRNILLGKPIPAIFLYKEAMGTKYTYNILDGKQRLESLILFIGAERDDFAIKNWHKYFFAERQKKEVGFWVEMPDTKQTFRQLSDEQIRDLREYSIPTVEISLSDVSSLDDIINLFVDINQQGVAVNRFDIVKALGKNDPLLNSVFKLIAQQQRRGQDIFYKATNSDFTAVLKKLQAVEKLRDANSKVDTMWERLLEIVKFFRTKKHRKPVEILKEFIAKPEQPSVKLSGAEARRLRKYFSFLRNSYKTTDLGETRLATDQTHFYTMLTSLIAGDLLANFNDLDLAKKLTRFGKALEDKAAPKDKHIARVIKEYREVSTKQTTDTSRREQTGVDPFSETVN